MYQTLRLHNSLIVVLVFSVTFLTSKSISALKVETISVDPKFQTIMYQEKEFSTYPIVSLVGVQSDIRLHPNLSLFAAFSWQSFLDSSPLNNWTIGSLGASYMFLGFHNQAFSFSPWVSLAIDHFSFDDLAVDSKRSFALTSQIGVDFFFTPKLFSRIGLGLSLFSAPASISQPIYRFEISIGYRLYDKIIMPRITPQNFAISKGQNGLPKKIKLTLKKGSVFVGMLVHEEESDIVFKSMTTGMLVVPRQDIVSMQNLK